LTAAECPGLQAYANDWLGGPYFKSPKGYHTATLLPGDRIMLVGGSPNPQEVFEPAGIEVFDTAPTGKLWTYPRVLLRDGHTLSRLLDGRVFILGGTELYAPKQAVAPLLYKPKKDEWSVPASPPLQPVRHSATTLSNGKVLVVGGRKNGFPISPEVARVWIYDPGTDGWQRVAPLHQARSDHTATLLTNGQVLVVGGFGTAGLLGNAELFDPASKTWLEVAGATARARHTATLLHSGKVLLVGGLTDGERATVQLFDPTTSGFVTAAPLEPNRELHTASRLRSGTVLITGGRIAGVGASGEVAVFEPKSGRWCSAKPMEHARYAHTATVLSDDSILVAGGHNLVHDASESARMYPAIRTTEILVRR